MVEASTISYRLSPCTLWSVPDGGGEGEPIWWDNTSFVIINLMCLLPTEEGLVGLHQ
jgi:hypothetical protein